jgi:CheY-like chemotaxis protein
MASLKEFIKKPNCRSYPEAAQLDADGHGRLAPALELLKRSDGWMVETEGSPRGNEDAAVTGPMQHPLRILVADDSRDAADSLAAVLRLWGHEVETVYDGPSAIARAQRFKPHVALLDIEMPRMHGGEVAARIRDLFPEEPVALLAMTAADPSDARLAGYDAVFDAFLLKPYDLGELEGFLTACSAQCPDATA